MSGTRYYVNGREVDEKEFTAGRPSLDSVLATPQGRRDVANTLRNDPHRRLGFESESASVPPGMAKSHHEWVQEQGLGGVEVLPSGNIRFSGSEREKDSYLTARGMADHSSAGADTKLSHLPNRKPARQRRSK